MDCLKIYTKFGETRIKNLGNARFREADIDGGIGELHVDFHGEAPMSGSVEVDIDIGSTYLVLPEQLGIKLDVSGFPILTEIVVPSMLRRHGRSYYSRDYERALASFDVRISQGIGEVIVE